MRHDVNAEMRARALVRISGGDGRVPKIGVKREGE